MENFIYEDVFCSDIGDLLHSLQIDEDDDVPNLPDDYSLVCVACELEPIVQIDADWIIEKIDEERFPEDSETTEHKLKKALSVIDFEKLNASMPNVWYPTKKKFTITKKDIVDFVS